MKYENADSIFPEKLLLEIRQYVPEGYVYISPQSSRKEWGSVSGQREELEKGTMKYIRNTMLVKVLIQFQKERMFMNIKHKLILINLKMKDH